MIQKLLGVEVDHQLRFNQHISLLCFKPAMHLNALSRLRRFMGRAEKAATINSFIHAINALWFRIFVHVSLPEKLTAFKSVAFYLNLMTTNVILKLWSGKSDSLRWKFKDCKFWLLKFWKQTKLTQEKHVHF